MRSAFLLRWLRNTSALFTGGFTAVELVMAVADNSIRQHTTGQGFVLVLALHLAACAGIGFALTLLLAAIDREAERLRPHRFQIKPLVAPAQKPLDRVARRLARFRVRGGLRDMLRATRQPPAPRRDWLQVNHRASDEPVAIVAAVDVHDDRVEYQIKPWPPKATQVSVIDGGRAKEQP